MCQMVLKVDCPLFRALSLVQLSLQMMVLLPLIIYKDIILPVLW